MSGPYDETDHTPGRSREVDAIAHAAAQELASNPDGVKVNDEDPANSNEEPLGNPNSPSYSDKRSIGGSK